MAKRLRLPRITSANRRALTPLLSEVMYDVDEKKLYCGDGATAGGVPLSNGAVNEQYVYGIDYDTSVATSANQCKRVVLNNGADYAGATPSVRYLQVDEFTQMPAHDFRRCVMDDLANRHVNYYLNASNSNLKANGQPAVLTGADGDVMVEIPVTYYRIDTYTDSSSHIHKVYLVCNKPFTNGRPHAAFFVSPNGDEAGLRTQYIGAFRSIICDSAGAVIEQIADSTPVPYASGRKFRSIMGGRPSGSFTQAQHRTGAGANGAQGINSAMQQFLLMMMAIDGCTFNTQEGISIGYCNAAAWDYMYVRPNGYTASLGNGTGSILSEDGVVMSDTRFIRNKSTDYGNPVTAYGWINGSTNRWTGNPNPQVGDAMFSDNTLTTQVGNISSVGADACIAWNATALADATKRVCAMSYRGIENPYGSQSCFEDGIQKNQTNAIASIIVSTVQYDRDPEDDGTSTFAWKDSENNKRWTSIVNPINGTAVFSDASASTSAGTVASTIADGTYSGFWMTTATSVYSDTDLGTGPAHSPYPTSGFTGATYQWVSQNWPKYSGYSTTFDPQTFFPTALGGSSSTYMGDYFYNNANAGARVVYRGSYLADGTSVGFGSVYVYSGPAYAHASFGARLSA